jgi:Raf kinase inhibitor-like YbhB/YbcL family protein
MSMTLQSTAFLNGETIPVKYTGEGQNVSPPLEWRGVPQSARELVLICDDPDAPTAEPWVHWLIYNLPPETQSLPEQIPRDDQIQEPVSAAQGLNSWPDGENMGYLGPMPPKGHGVHHYHFKLYALDTAINLRPGVNKSQLLTAMSNHIVATAELIGTYERK